MRRRRPQVLVLHHCPDEREGAGVWRESDAGVLAEVDAVAGALAHLGLHHRVVGVARLADLPALLAEAPEPIVFNLIESFSEGPAEANVVPSLCRRWGKACTGSPTAALVLAQDKWQVRPVLRAAGLACPPAVLVPVGEPVVLSRFPAGTLIVKPAAADASEGITARSVHRRPGPALRRAVGRIHRQFGQPALVERFIDGREINVSLLEQDGRVSVLPLAEIDFSAFPSAWPRIVDYAAKWIPDSPQYRTTPPVIPARLPATVAAEIRRTAIAAWRAVGCRGYARVDIRLSPRNRPYVIDVNPNPDVGPDAGFQAALKAAGIPFYAFVENEVTRALKEAPAATVAAEPPQAVSRPTAKIRIRRSMPRDRRAILALLADSRLFRSDELAVAREVLDDALAKGPSGHYQSLVADEAGRTVGWVCFGPTPCTVGTFDVYWIGVAPDRQGRGIGAALMRYAERMIADRGGRMVVVETAGRADYTRTRGFYERLGYRRAASVADFYAPGDAKVIYTKLLPASCTPFRQRHATDGQREV